MTGRARPKRADGWWYPWLFVAFMAGVMVVNGAMIALAVGSFSGLSTDDAYRRGIEYNAALEGARAQDALGWTADLRFEAAGAPGGGRLAVRFLDGAGRPLDGLGLAGELRRPTRSGLDQPLAMEGLGDGRYAATLAHAQSGQWDVRLVARRGDDVFQLSRRITVP